MGVDDSLAGPWPAPPSARSLVHELGRDPGRLRIGCCVDAFNGAEVDEACAAAAVDVAARLEALGDAAAELDAWSRTLARVLGEADVEPATWQLVESGRTVTGAEVLAPLAPRQEISRRALAWWADGFDLLLIPTTAEPAPPLGADTSGYQPGRASAFTRLFNATGQPALSLPLGWSADGLPRGVQLVAAYGREDVLVPSAPSWRRPPPGRTAAAAARVAPSDRPRSFSSSESTVAWPRSMTTTARGPPCPMSGGSRSVGERRRHPRAGGKRRCVHRVSRPPPTRKGRWRGVPALPGSRCSRPASVG